MKKKLTYEDKLCAKLEARLWGKHKVKTKPKSIPRDLISGVRLA